VIDHVGNVEDVHDVRFFSFAIFFARPDIVIQFLVLKEGIITSCP